MAAFDSRRRKTRRLWYSGLALLATALLAVFLVGGASAVTNSPSNFESADGNMTVQGTSATPGTVSRTGVRVTPPAL